MHRACALLLAMGLFASSAHAYGIDLTVNACSGSPGASYDAGTLDCAGGSTLVLLATFQPAEDISDLVAADAIIDLTIGPWASGNVNGPDNFWDFGSFNSGALNGSAKRPVTGCDLFSDAFGPNGSGIWIASAVQQPYRTRIATTSYRPSKLAVLANQRIFAFQVFIDLSTSVEAGTGTATGCQSMAAVNFQQLIPGSASNLPVSTLVNGSPGPYTVVYANFVAISPATRHSWGQLKSLYR